LKESINGIRKELSAESEIKRDEIKAQNMKRKGLLRKYSMEKKENWDQELKQKNYQQRRNCVDTGKGSH
jgi:hypothetical protein